MKPKSQILILKWEVQHKRLNKVFWILCRDTPAKRSSFFLPGLMEGLLKVEARPHL